MCRISKSSDFTIGFAFVTFANKIVLEKRPKSKLRQMSKLFIKMKISQIKCVDSLIVLIRRIRRTTTKILTRKYLISKKKFVRIKLFERENPYILINMTQNKQNYVYFIERLPINCRKALKWKTKIAFSSTRILFSELCLFESMHAYTVTTNE